MIMRLIFFLVSIVFIYPNENDSYTFISKYSLNELIKKRTETTLNFSFGSYENQSNSDVKITEKYLGKENGFILIEKNCTDMISTYIVLGEMSVNAEMGRLIGIPYIIFIDSTGIVFDIETEHLQYEEQIRSMELDMAGINNYIYPFGEDAVDIKVGGKWEVKSDSILFYPGDGEYENYMNVEGTFTLDKVKPKGGRTVAYITAKYNCTVEQMLYQQGGKIFEGTMAGSGKSKIRWDLEKGERILDKQDMSMQWNVSFEDRHLVENMNFTSKTKWTK